MSIDMTANDFLMGGGIPAAKFDTIGTTVGGPISQPPRVEQQKDLDTGDPKFWNDGKPMVQMIVTVQTSLRDPEITDDDGQRTFYIKANSLKAVRDAVRAAGAKGLEVGGTLTLTYTGDGEQKKRGFNPPKLYTATYTAPSAAAANEFLNGGHQPPAPQQPAPVPQPGAYAGALQQSAAHNAAQPTAFAQAAAPELAAMPNPAQAAYNAAQTAQAPADGGVWTPPPGMDPNQAAALAALQPAQRAALGY